MLSLLLLLLSPAHAADHEINVEAGWLGADDDAWAVFSESGLYGTGGLRIGYAFHPRIAAIAGWQRGRAGAEVYVPGFEEAPLFSGFAADQFTLGVKADVKVFEWLHPYATVQGDLLRAVARFDDDLSEDDNPGQIKAAGVTGGALFTAGLDFPIEIRQSGLAIAPYAELGYGLLAPVTLGDFGDVHLGGFTGRTGVGLRF